MPISYDYRTADGDPNYPTPPYLPSIGLMQSQHTNLKTAIGVFPPDNVEVKSRYYTSQEIAKLAPEYLETTRVASAVQRGVSLEEDHPGAIRRMTKTVTGLAVVGGVSLLLIFAGLV